MSIYPMMEANSLTAIHGVYKPIHDYMYMDIISIYIYIHIGFIHDTHTYTHVLKHIHTQTHIYTYTHEDYIRHNMHTYMGCIHACIHTDRQVYYPMTDRQ